MKKLSLMLVMGLLLLAGVSQLGMAVTHTCEEECLLEQRANLAECGDLPTYMKADCRRGAMELYLLCVSRCP